MDDQSTPAARPRRQLLQTLGLGSLGAAGLVALAAAVPPSAAAGDGASIVGVWRLDVRRPTGTVHAVYDVYLRDGLMFQVTSLRRREDLGIGVWEQVGEDRFTFVFERFLYGDDGEVQGHRVIEDEATVTGDTIEVRGPATTYDLAGNLVESYISTITGTRLRLRR